MTHTTEYMTGLDPRLAQSKVPIPVWKRWGVVYQTPEEYWYEYYETHRRVDRSPEHAQYIYGRVLTNCLRHSRAPRSRAAAKRMRRRAHQSAADAYENTCGMAYTG